MSKGRVFIIVTALLSILFTTPGVSLSSSDTKSLVIKAKIEKVLKLIVDTILISFPNKDPDEVTEIPAVQNDVKVIVKVRTGATSPVTLNLIADGDLFSGSDTIPVQNVYWQASGQGFQGGLLSKTTVQTAGSWTGCGVREGAFRYYLKNSWNYPRGEYQATITYTLTTP